MRLRKRSKYLNKRAEIDGRKFHSLSEAKRYQELKLLEHSGQISTLILQPRFPLFVEGFKVATYVGDFQYSESGRVIVEDVKGFATDVFKLKAKIFKICYPQIELRIVSAR